MLNYATGYKRTQYEDLGLCFEKPTQVQARYICSFDVTHNGHRLIEALPPLRTRKECFQDFTKTPHWGPEMRQRSAFERRALCSHLTQLKAPRDFTYDVDVEIHSLMIRCYMERLPNECIGSFTPGFYCITGNPVPGAALFGDSGVGKSTAVKHALHYYPNMIVHEMEDARMVQIPYILVDCPPDASIKAFYDSCLSQVEIITGQPITGRKSKETADEKAKIFRHQMLRFNVGLIVVDEVQNVMNAQKKMLMKHFLNLSNTLSIPFLFIGVKEVKNFFSKEGFYIKRRIGRELLAERFEKNELWNSFIAKLWKYQWTKEEIPFSEEMNEVLYRETAGNVDRIKELFRRTQEKAIEMGCDTAEGFTVDFVREISHKFFSTSYEDLYSVQEKKKMPTLKNGFSDIESTKELLALKGGREEFIERVKFCVVENISTFSKGKYRKQEIERVFDSFSKNKDVLSIEETIVTMNVLKYLMGNEEKVSEKRQQLKKQKVLSIEEVPIVGKVCVPK